jgi:hypothetical protein
MVLSSPVPTSSRSKTQLRELRPNLSGDVTEPEKVILLISCTNMKRTPSHASYNTGDLQVSQVNQIRARAPP